MHLSYRDMVELQNDLVKFVQRKTEPDLQLLFVYYDEIAFIKEVIGPMVSMALDQFEGVDSQIVLLIYGLEIGFPQNRRQLIN